MDSDLKEFIVFIGVTLLLITLYYVYWGIPHDQALYNIMDCMGDDHSIEAYNLCVEEMK